MEQEKTIDELRAIVRNLRSNTPLEGFTLVNNILTDEKAGIKYRVSGTFRIMLEKIPQEPADIPEGDQMGPPVQEPADIPQAVPPEHTEAMSTGKVKKERKAATPKSDRPRDENGKIITTEKRVCKTCGKEFEASIYTKRDECYDCKPKSSFSIKRSDRPRDETGKVITTETRKCAKCGKEFQISIYASRKECYDCAPVKSQSKATRDADGNVIKTVTVTCDKCGKEFVRSIYNPYQTSCPDCREHKGKAAKPKAEDVKHVCTICNQEFTVSKFATPEQKANTVCKSCRKAMKRGIVSERKAETPQAATEQTA
jgi:DNA-directed RNA polymerase subunit RPC12/RpoP